LVLQQGKRKREVEKNDGKRKKKGNFQEKSIHLKKPKYKKKKTNNSRNKESKYYYIIFIVLTSLIEETHRDSECKAKKYRHKGIDRKRYNLVWEKIHYAYKYDKYSMVPKRVIKYIIPRLGYEVVWGKKKVYSSTDNDMIRNSGIDGAKNRIHHPIKSDVKKTHWWKKWARRPEPRKIFGNFGEKSSWLMRDRLREKKWGKIKRKKYKKTKKYYAKKDWPYLIAPIYKYDMYKTKKKVHTFLEIYRQEKYKEEKWGECNKKWV
jgi:hypothetical protein